jgi:putative ABC transport system substrate-binding protein
VKRRDAIAGLIGAALLPVCAAAQERPWRIGFLYFGPRRSAIGAGRYEAFVKALRELGYVEGKNIVIEARFADNSAERAAKLATELARVKVDVIVTGGSPANHAAQRATKTIPIVVVHSPDPVGEGLAASLGRPGGNVTGMSTRNSELDAKHVELLRVAFPKLARVAVMWNPDNRTHQSRVKAVQAAGEKIGVAVVPVSAENREALERAFASIASAKAEAAIVLSDTLFIGESQYISMLALTHRLPSSSATREYAEGGGLISFGAHTSANYPRAAVFVDKILRGTKPADLPIEQSANFELVVNMKAARAMGLKLPEAFLVRADQVIE